MNVLTTGPVRSSACDVRIGPHPDQRGTWLLRTTQWFPRRREELFEFFGDAFNLEQITPPFLHFQVQTARPISMRPGTLIEYRLKLHVLPIRWKTEITAWEPGIRFIDTQLRGPYRLWVHEHRFYDDAGGTRVEDAVSYRVPMQSWPGVGWMVHALFVQRDLRTIFTYRGQVLKRLFGAAAHGSDSAR